MEITNSTTLENVKSLPTGKLLILRNNKEWLETMGLWELEWAVGVAFDEPRINGEVQSQAEFVELQAPNHFRVIQ